MSRPRTTLLALVASAWIGCEDPAQPLLPETTFPTHVQNAALPPLIDGSRTVVTFDASLGELPEGVAVTPGGDLLVSISPLGQVRKIARDGSQSVLAALGGSVFGLAADRSGDVYAAVASFNPATHGVWRIDPQGNTQRLPGSGSIVFPNAIALNPAQDVVYVTDTFLGAVWRIAVGGSAELWIQHPLLQGLGIIRPDGRPLGANGIVYRDGDVFVANTEGARVVRIPVQSDGTAGGPAVFAAGAALFSVDGLGADATGNLYAVIIGFHRVVRIARDGSEMTPIATAADGLDFPASIAFGRDGVDRLTAFVTSFAIGPSSDPARPGPSVVQIPVGLPGGP